MLKKLLLKRGTTAEHSTFTGAEREVTVDTDKKTLVVHDGKTPGGFPLARAADKPTKLSELTEDIGVWKKSELTKLSQLENDPGYWKDLTKISQLTNDKSFVKGHCTYCTHCTYCSLCSRCNTQQCNQVKCSNCTYCSNCAHNYCTDCSDCGDDNS